MICKTCQHNKIAHWAQLKTVLADAGINIGTPLFHSTSLANAKKIVATGFKAQAGGEHNDSYWDNAVCFTRNLDFAKAEMFGDSQAIFIMDANQLKSRFHTYSYDWHDINKDEISQYTRKSPQHFEYEERVSVEPSKFKTKRDMANSEDGFCLMGTVIKPSYIKAVLVHKIRESFPDIPTFYYKNNRYLPMDAMESHVDKLTTGELTDLAEITQDQKLLEELANSTEYFVQQAVLLNPHVTDPIIEQLYPTASVHTKGQMAAVTTNPLLMDKLADEKQNSTLLKELAKNPHVSTEILDKIFRNGYDKILKNVDWLIASNVSKHKNTSPYVLEELSHYGDPDIRMRVAENESVPFHVLEQLAKDDTPYVRAVVAENLRTPKRVLIELAKDREDDVIVEVARNPNTPKDILLNFAKGEYRHRIQMVARDTLKYLGVTV